MQKPMLNLGCGRVILPAEKPAHYGLLPDGLTDYALWLNVDRNAAPGVDKVMDAFAYPWDFEDNSFDGALLSHLVEHIPHEIRTPSALLDSGIYERFHAMQDGWFAFFSELYRVLTPGAIVHILCPYGWSAGAAGDPTHTRYVTEVTFNHSMEPNPDAPFAYATGGLHFRMAAPPQFGISPLFQHLVPQAGDTEHIAQHKTVELQRAVMTQMNVVNDLYVRLECVK